MITALDIETTGLSKKDCGICQLSMVKMDDDLNVIKTWDRYIKPRPDAVWNDNAMNCSGITPEMVANEPTIKDLAKEIVDFIGDDDILTFNGNSFDLPFLQEELKRAGVNLILSNRKLYDGYYIEQSINPRKLTALYEKYTGNVLENAHNSLADTMATIEVFKHQRELVKDWSKINLSYNFGGCVGTDEDGENVFLIGKYKGMHVQDVIKKDPNWVSWLIKEKQDNDFFLFIKKEYEKVKHSNNS